MSERVDRHHVRIKSRSLYCFGKEAAVIILDPSLAVRSRKQDAVASRQALCERFRYRHRPACSLFLAATLAADRHHQARLACQLDVFTMQSRQLRRACSGRGSNLDEQAELLTDLVGRGNDRPHLLFSQDDVARLASAWESFESVLPSLAAGDVRNEPRCGRDGGSGSAPRNGAPR